MGRGRSKFDYYDGYRVQHGYISTFLDHWHQKDVNEAIKHKKLIDRCFYSRNVEEIMDNLRKEEHPFAKEILQQM